MIQRFGLGLCLVSLVACSVGQDKTASRRADSKKTNSSDPTTADVQPTALDCSAQWALVIKQQRSGASFNYQSDIKSPYLTKSVTRTDRITAASDVSIERQISINDPMVTQFIGGLANQTVLLKKDQFLSSCQNQTNQPVVTSVMGGQAMFNPPIQESLSINGKVISATKYVGQVTNVTYAGSAVSADLIVYLSPLYPALPLKQIISIKQSSLAILVGAQITDVLQPPLPGTP
jgi:hypothetical protein